MIILRIRKSLQTQIWGDNQVIEPLCCNEQIKPKGKRGPILHL